MTKSGTIYLNSYFQKDENFLKDLVTELETIYFNSEDKEIPEGTTEYRVLITLNKVKKDKKCRS